MFRKKDTKEIKNYVVIPSPEVLAFDKNPNDVDAVSLMSDTLTSHKSIGKTIQKNATVSPSITMTRPKAQTDVNFSDLNPSRGVSMTSSNTGLRYRSQKTRIVRPKNVFFLIFFCHVFIRSITFDSVDII